jgi:type VI secretion system protein ImpK
MPSSRDDLDATDFGAPAQGTQSLVDLCREAFLLIFHIRAGNDPGHPDDLRKSVGALLRNLDARAAKAGHSEEDAKATRYALCAVIDETILNSRWSFKDQWAARPLQLEHFGEQLAGERFFDLLDRVRQKGRRKADLLEVFCVVLILGFQGKYKMRPGEDLANLTREVVQEVQQHKGGISGISPHWKIPEERVEKPLQTIPLWAWVTGVAAIALVIVVYVVFKLWLDSAASDAVRRLIL